MTMPQATAFDTGNSLLAAAETPALLTTSLVDAPKGQLLAITIRTPTTTLTVMLSRADSKMWGDQIVTQADSMSRSGLVVANGHGASVVTRRPGDGVDQVGG